jgi:hypothetical protein
MEYSYEYKNGQHGAQLDTMCIYVCVVLNVIETFDLTFPSRDIKC